MSHQQNKIKVWCIILLLFISSVVLETTFLLYNNSVTVPTNRWISHCF
jgi:hypothetical protein